MEHSEQLAHLITDLTQQQLADSSHECIPTSVQETIISWLGGIDLVSWTSM